MSSRCISHHLPGTGCLTSSARPVNRSHRAQMSMSSTVSSHATAPAIVMAGFSPWAYASPPAEPFQRPGVSRTSVARPPSLTQGRRGATAAGGVVEESTQGLGPPARVKVAGRAPRFLQRGTQLRQSENGGGDAVVGLGPPIVETGRSTTGIWSARLSPRTRTPACLVALPTFLAPSPSSKRRVSHRLKPLQTRI